MTEPALQPESRPIGGDEGARPLPPTAPATDPARAGGADGSDAQPVCTQAQLRRFIKSRPYVPLHELRRRFGLNGADDDVSPVDVHGKRLFVGLPDSRGRASRRPLRQGDVGYELLLDPMSPTIIGVFPIRPVQRP